MGKADAISRGILMTGNVKAFSCRASLCGSLLPNVKYFFAVSGDPAAGGAFFTTDSSARGPGNTENWAGSNYFNGAKEYWSNRNSFSTSLWNNDTQGSPTINMCSNWASDSAAHGGNTGFSNSVSSARWSFAATPITCDQMRRLVCIVNP